MDGEKVAGQEVGLAAGGTRTLALPHRFERLGPHSGHVEVDADDLPADNRRFFAVTVREKVPVLIVNGAPSAIPYRDGSFYLRLALEGRSERGETLSPIRTRTVTAREFASVRLQDYACVILAGVPRLGEQDAQRLARYVQGGGGLLVFAGAGVDPAS
jgi:hypothetical protein